jgi:hypothetical protein
MRSGVWIANAFVALAAAAADPYPEQSRRRALEDIGANLIVIKVSERGPLSKKGDLPWVEEERYLVALLSRSRQLEVGRLLPRTLAATPRGP